MPANDRADDSAEDRAGDCARTSADPWKDRAGNSASTRPDRRARRFARYHVIALRVRGATAKREAACDSGRN
jgi:hypothetical protein